jgi:hypothetical protein
MPNLSLSSLTAALATVAAGAVMIGCAGTTAAVAAKEAPMHTSAASAGHASCSAAGCGATAEKEAPKAEAPKTEAPMKAEAPKAEAPKTEAAPGEMKSEAKPVVAAKPKPKAASPRKHGASSCGAGTCAASK